MDKETAKDTSSKDLKSLIKWLPEAFGAPCYIEADDELGEDVIYKHDPTWCDDESHCDNHQHLCWVHYLLAKGIIKENPFKK